MMPSRRQGGLTIVEILVALLLVSVLIAGVMSLYSLNRRVRMQEDIGANLEAYLRVATNEIERNLRNAGYGVPFPDTNIWLNWVPGGLASDFQITQGASGAPDTLRLARCTLAPVTTLSADAAAGSTSISVASTAPFNTTNRSVLMLDIDQFARVTGISGSTLTIDTEPTLTGAQGLPRDFPSGTPICRTDAMTFAVNTANDTLTIDRHDGAAAEIIASEIVDLQIAPFAGINNFRISVGGQSTDVDPTTGTTVSRTATIHVAVRN